MDKLMFETSLGAVVCTVDCTKPDLSDDPEFQGYVISEGKITIIKGKEYLDKLYTWNCLFLRCGWVFVDLDDGYYVSPEYKSIRLPLV